MPDTREARAELSPLTEGERRTHDELERLVEERTAELAQANAALQESEKRYRALSEVSSDYVFILAVRPNGQVFQEWASDGVKRTTGHSLDELNQLRWRSFIVAEDIPHHAEHLRKTVLTNQPTTWDSRIITKAGDIRWLHFYTQPEWGEARP